MRVVFSDDARDFVRRDWSALVARDPDATFFHTPAYLKLYWEEFGADASLLLAFAEEESDPGRAVGAAAFERSGAVLRFLGGTEVTDHMGPVSEPEAADRVAKELMCALGDLDWWTEAELGGLVEDSGWLARLTGACREAGYEVAVEDDRNGVAPLLALPDSYEGYLSTLPARLRHEIRRQGRRVEAGSGQSRMVRTTTETLSSDLDRFVGLHQASEGPKGRFMQPGMEIFFRRLGETFLPSGTFRLSFLEIDDEKAAGAIGFAFRDTFSLYNSAFDRRWSALSPGMVLVAELIRSAIEEGYGTFDFLKGDLAYKYRFGAVPRAVKLLRLSR